MRPASRLPLAVAFVFAFAEPVARAEGIAASRFEPADRGGRFFVADSLDLPAARTQVAAGVAATHASRTRLFGARTDGERSRLIESALFLHPGAAVVLAPGARFGLDVPLAVHQDGQPASIAGRVYPPPGSPRFGDVRLSFALHLFGQSDRAQNGFALAGGLTGYLPTGSQTDFTGDGFARFAVNAAAAYRYEFILVATRAEYMYRPSDQLEGVLPGAELHYRGALAFSNDTWTVGPEIFGATAIDATFARRQSPLELLLGLHRRVEDFTVGVGVGTALAPGLGAPHLRAVLSIEWAPRPRAADRDRDGVEDLLDGCPDVPGERAPDPRANGCPPAPPLPSPRLTPADAAGNDAGAREPSSEPPGDAPGGPEIQ